MEAKVKIGDTTSGNELDITVAKDGNAKGIEIVVNSLIIENIPTHLKYCQELLILVIDEKKRKQIMKQIEGLDQEIRERLEVDLLRNYFISYV